MGIATVTLFCETAVTESLGIAFASLGVDPEPLPLLVPGPGENQIEAREVG
jgi:hypothetical protein